MTLEAVFFVDPIGESTGPLDIYLQRQFEKFKMFLGAVNATISTEDIDDRVAALLVEGSNISLVYNDVANTLTISAAGGGSGVTSFETVSKNLDASNASLVYSGGDLVQVNYANGIVKTFNYSGGNLVSIVLSGSVPGGIDLTKTLIYTGSDLTGISYS